MIKTIAIAFILFTSIQIAYTVREYAVDSDKCCDDKFLKDDGTCGDCVDTTCKCKSHPEIGDANNECTVCPTDCKTCAKGTECLICNTGKDLKDADKSCSAITTTKVATCATQSHESTCATCAEDKQHNTGKTDCEACGTGCAKCSDTACTECTTPATQSVQVTDPKTCAICHATCTTCDGDQAADCWNCKDEARDAGTDIIETNLRGDAAIKGACDAGNKKKTKCNAGNVLLTDNTCTAIDAAAAIYGCKYYVTKTADYKAQTFHGVVGDQVCIECKTGFTAEDVAGSTVGAKTCKCGDGTMKAKAGADCAAITAVTGCSTYQKADAAKCEKCEDGKVRAVDGTTCTAFTTPANCNQVDPATVTNCLECKAGFKISAANACEAHGIAGCTTNDDKKCTKCEDGYSATKDQLKCVKCHENCKACYSKCATNGCRICHDTTNTEKGSCACKSGWEYKSGDPKKCVEKTVETDSGDEESSSVSNKLIYSMITLVVALLFL